MGFKFASSLYFISPTRISLVGDVSGTYNIPHQQLLQELVKKVDAFGGT
jgi:hypothetical protein